MKASEAILLDFLKHATQFVIPIYQRTYSWTDKQCEQLWQDIFRAGSHDDIKLHFVGSVVYVQDGLAGVMDSTWLVIDGQQRLTTVSLLLEALARAVGDDEPLEGFTAPRIRDFYLRNPYEKGEKTFKLLLSENDKETLKALVADRPRDELGDRASVRVLANFDFFANKIKQHRDNLETICRGIAKLAIVDISLNRDYDNPQLIFESMNSTGKALSQADLIRNFILMGLEPEMQSELYSDYWRPMEIDFGQEAYASQFDVFMRHYLTVKTGSIPRIGDVYDAFKSDVSNKGNVSDYAKPVLAEILSYSRYFCRMTLGQEQDRELKLAFQDLFSDLNYGVALPFLLELYADYEADLLSKSDFLAAIRLTESYVFRRSIVEIPTNSLNKTFAELTKKLDKNNYLESIKAQFLLMPSYRRFPSDNEFERSIQSKNLYNIYSRAYWLRRMENFGRKEPIVVENYTIEHLMPQNPNLSDEWQEELGENWQQVQSQYLHTLGNLTLTGYNSELSDRPFAEKRDMENYGLRHSPLKLNQGFGSVEKWNEISITTRARRLAKEALTVWPSPFLDPSVLESYRPLAVSNRPTYSYEDHEYLLRPDVQELFSELKLQILNLDPAIYEEVLKFYIAFKAETNFVDIITRANGLTLSLGLTKEEIEDPQNLTVDVSGVGRWGNGATELTISSKEDLPYALGLIRQAFDKQMASTVNN